MDYIIYTTKCNYHLMVLIKSLLLNRDICMDILLYELNFAFAYYI